MLVHNTGKVCIVTLFVIRRNKPHLIVDNTKVKTLISWLLHRYRYQIHNAACIYTNVTVLYSVSNTHREDTYTIHVHCGCI